MQNELSDMGFIRLDQILAIYPVSRSTWYEGVKSGRYPQSVRLGPNIVAWRSKDIRDLLAQASGQDPATDA